MINLKYALKDLMNRPKFTLMIIIQIIVSVILMNIGLVIADYVQGNVNKIKSIFPNEGVYGITQTNNNYENMDTKDLKNFENYLKSNNKFTRVTFYEDSFFIKSFSGIDKFQRAFFPRTVDGQSFLPVAQITVGENFFDNFKFQLSEGRLFNKDEYNLSNGDIKPVILGNNYKKIYKLGDELSYLDAYSKIEHFKIIGFLDSNSYFINSLSPDNVISIDNYIIYPQQNVIERNLTTKYDDEIYKIDLMNSYRGCILVTSSNEVKTKDTLTEISKVANDNNITIKITSLNSPIQEFKDRFNKVIVIAYLFGIITIAFTSIGLIISILHIISQSTKDFGIHLMSGGTLIDISKRILFEILILFISGYLVGVILTYELYKIGYIFGFNLITEFKLFALYMIIACITTIIPFRKILKLSINNLIKGE